MWLEARALQIAHLQLGCCLSLDSEEVQDVAAVALAALIAAANRHASPARVIVTSEYGSSRFSS